MKNFIATTLAFVKKDFLNEASYRFSFFLGALYLLANIAIFFFVDKMFGDKMNPHLARFGTPYFSYVFLGIVFFNFVGPGISSLASKIRTEQYQGTLESLVLAPIGAKSLLAGLSAWNFLYSLAELAIYVPLGVFVFSIDLSSVNFLSFLIVSVLSVANFISLGIISACFVIVFKRGNPVSWLLTPLEGLLGGVYFPISVFPESIQVLSHCLPVTYAVKALQLSVYQNASPGDIKSEIIILFLFSAVLAPLSAFLFEKSLKKALADGQISNY